MHMTNTRRRSGSNRGFTIVELVVVVAVIAIISSIAAFSFSRVQRSSRDDQREANLVTFRTALDDFFVKNGTYPPGCPQTSCSSWFFTENTASPTITANTPLSAIRTVLPGIPETFNDPSVRGSDLFFMDTTQSTKKYFYYGGTANLRTGSGSADTTLTATASFPCTLRSALTSGGPLSTGSYVTGYYSEDAKKWVLYGGQHGVSMTISGSDALGCVINR